MDIQRPSNARAKKIRRIIYAAVAFLLIGGVSFGLSRLRPAAPTVDRATIWTDDVKRGPMLREVRGLGLMIGIELRAKAAPVLQALQDDGVLVIGAGSSVVRLLPPLVITDDQWSRSLDALGRALQHG